MDQIRTGNFIRLLRREHGWSQSEFAGRLNCSEKTVSKWETGRGLPEVSLMLPVCELFGITVNELLSGERLDHREHGIRSVFRYNGGLRCVKNRQSYGHIMKQLN